MGTNFYHLKRKLKEGEDHDKGLHIGKRSCGWVFHFEAHNEPFLKSFSDYKEFLKKGYIYDEYDRLIPYDDFIKLVEETKEIEPDGEPPWSFDNYPDDCGYSVFEDWMSDGFMFTLSDFR